MCRAFIVPTVINIINHYNHAILSAIVSKVVSREEKIVKIADTEGSMTKRD
jgi:hypothetical protein